MRAWAQQLEPKSYLPVKNKELRMTQQPAAQRPTGWRGNKVKNPGDRMRYSPTRGMKASALLELIGSARASGNSPHLRSYNETSEAEWR